MRGTQVAPNVTVNQGPTWIADLYLTPPTWVNQVIRIVGVLVLVAVAWRLHQRGWSVDAQTQLEMGRIAGTVVAVATGVLAMTTRTALPYAVDVGVGFVVGYGFVVVASSTPALRWARETVPDDTTRRTSAWLLLALLSLFAPVVAAAQGSVINVMSGRLAIAAVAVAMAALNIHERVQAADDSDASFS